MEKAPQQQNTIQDTFLNSARKERSNVTIYLMSGVKLTGRIKSFDKYSVILEAGSQEQLIFKHAISTVSLPRGGGRDFHHSRAPSPSDREHHPDREHQTDQPAGGQAGTAAGQERP
jgi:host factor-I protein